MGRKKYIIHSSLQLEYFETVLGAYFSTEARASFTSLHDLLLEKAAECVIEASETPVHRRRTTRGCEDAMNEDSHPVATMAPDDLLVRFIPIMYSVLFVMITDCRHLSVGPRTAV